jgi:hypothetical protein
MPSASASSVLDAENSQFLQRRVSIVAASRDAQNRPFCARAYGCRVGPDGLTLTVFVQRPQAARLLSDIECNGQIAVVFSRPSTHWALQLKGGDARVGALQPGDAQAVAEWVGSFVVEVTPLGFTAPFVHAACAIRPDDMAAITFTPSEGFAQTPGPGAGARLSKASPPADGEPQPT